MNSMNYIENHNTVCRKISKDIDLIFLDIKIRKTKDS